MANKLTENNEAQPIDSVPLYRKKRVIIPFLVLVIVTVIVAAYWYVNLRGIVATDDAYIDGDRVSISSKILGRITRLAVDEGDQVTKGQALVYLDDSDLKAQETHANAMLENAQQGVVLAKINLDKAQEDYQRDDSLFKNGNIPKQQFDHSQKAFEASEAQYKIAQSQVKVAESQLEVIRTQLLNTVIKAPFKGTVSKKWALVGDVVQAGQPIFAIYNMQNIWVTANLEETKLESIKLGDPVEISVDSYPSLAYQGNVIRLGSNTASQFSLIPPNNASGNFTKVTQRIPIKISIESSEGGSGTKRPLLPGMSVEVRIKVSHQE